jgi:hypothetical protein
LLVVTATFLINTKQSKARIKITLNPLPLYEYIKLSMERMSSLHTEIQNGPHSMTYLTCDHTRKCKKKPTVSYKQLE